MSNTTIRGESSRKKQIIRRYLLSPLLLITIFTTTACIDDFKRAATAFIIEPTSGPKNHILIMRDGNKILHSHTVQLIYLSDNHTVEHISDVNGQVIFAIPANRIGDVANIKILDPSGKQMCHWNIVAGDQTFHQLNMMAETAEIAELTPEPTEDIIVAGLPNPVSPIASPQPTATPIPTSTPTPTPIPPFIEEFDTGHADWVHDTLPSTPHQIETALENGLLYYDVTFGGEGRILALSEIPYHIPSSNYTFSADVAMQTPPMRGPVAISLIFGRSPTKDSFYSARFYPQTRTYEVSRYENGARRLAKVHSGEIDPDIFNGNAGDRNNYAIRLSQNELTVYINGNVIAQVPLTELPEEHHFAIAVDGTSEEKTILIFDRIEITPLAP